MGEKCEQHEKSGILTIYGIKTLKNAGRIVKKVEKYERHAVTHHFLAILVTPFHMEGGVGVACGEVVRIS